MTSVHDDLTGATGATSPSPLGERVGVRGASTEEPGSRPPHPNLLPEGRRDENQSQLEPVKRDGTSVTDAQGRARVFTVPAGQPFLACLVRALLDGNLPAPGGGAPDPLLLPDTTLLMPTRRAMRGLQDAFLAATDGRAMLLPRIRPIAEGDEELTLLAGLSGLARIDAATADLDPAIPEMERRLALAALVLAWSRSMRAAAADETGELGMGPVSAAGASTPAQSAKLAADLARLMDMVETEGRSLDKLADLVPEEFSEHWKATIDFLRIVTEHWPSHLAAQGLLSPKDRQNRTILAEAARIRDFPPPTPLIVAGVSGSIPATAELMRAVLALPNAAIVLPALDLDLDEASWQAIAPLEEGAAGHPEHPQYGLKRLLDRLGLTRADVSVLPGAEGTPALAARRRLVSEAMRPAATTGLCRGYIEREGIAGSVERANLAAALADLSLVEAPGAQDEAEVVALILREAAETPGRTAALVSPDRLLARRVAVRLESWGIRVDDSAGRPFAKTVPGAFLDLVIGAIEQDFAPADVMALLKHPLTRLGLTPFEVRRAARALEIAAFRMPYLGRGLDGVAAALAKAEDLRLSGKASRPQKRLYGEDMTGANDLVRRLRDAYAPLAALYDNRDAHPLRELAAAHLAVAEALVADAPDADGLAPRSELYVGEAGLTAANLFDGLKREHQLAPIIPAADYADLYRGLVAAENVRPKIPLHPRLFIWGPLEARLQQADVLVLGSLNDGTWPESADPGPWLNRPMRQTLGLPSPEERIGHAAHDFSALLSSPRVILTRAMKRDGVPTVESRWLLRLKALLAGFDMEHALEPAEPWLAWAVNRDDAPRQPPIGMPRPCPALDLRPRKLSVSNIERWIANPYAIYAQHILKLDPMPPLGQPPDASLRGSIIHDALSRFAIAYPTALPPDPGAELAEIVREVLTEWTGHPRVAAFWLPRLERFADWFGDTEPRRRRDMARTISELSGRLVLTDLPGGPFTMTARADRIDVMAGSLVVATDYKSGGYPPDSRVQSGEAPQLPLEAAIIAAEVGFPGISPARVAALRYIRASGGDPPGEQHDVKCDDIGALADKVLDGLRLLVTLYDDPATPYAPVRRARFSYDYDDYAHLARVAEWSALEAAVSEHAAHEVGEDA